jgi:hypothetical protein
MAEEQDLHRLADALTIESREDLLRAVRAALRRLVSLEGAVVERLEHEHFLVLSDAQEELALAYTRAGGQHLEGVCAMCGRVLTPAEGAAAAICAHCERSYGPDTPEE